MLVTLDLEDVASVIDEAIERALTPLREREASLTAEVDSLREQIARGALRGEPGASVTLEDVAPLIETGLARAVSALPPPEPGPPGESVDIEAVRQMVVDAVAALPPAQPGPPGASVDPETVRQMVYEAVAALPVPANGADGVDGRDGRDADPELVRQMVAEAVAEIPPAQAGRDGADGKDGKDADPALIEEMIRAEIAKLPPAQAGKDADPTEIARQVAEAVAALPAPAAGAPGSPGADGKDGKDGKDADPETVRAMVTEAVAALPPPERGEKGEPGHAPTEAEIMPLIERAVAAIPKPRDGVGLADALIDRAGQLVLTLTDGAVRKLGTVVGRDVDMEAVRAAVAGEVAKIPPPRDGVDGVGFDDVQVERSGDRAVTIRFSKGEHVREFPIALPGLLIYRGVYRDGTEYEAGDTVTWAGSLWHANAATGEKPDASAAWTLAAKRGRDGKDGKDGKPGERGPEGKQGMPGRDRY